MKPEPSDWLRLCTLKIPGRSPSYARLHGKPKPQILVSFMHLDHFYDTGLQSLRAHIPRCNAAVLRWTGEYQPHPRHVCLGDACQAAQRSAPMTTGPGSASALKMASLNRGPHRATSLKCTVLMEWDQKRKQPYCKWSLYPPQTSTLGPLLIPLGFSHKFGIKYNKVSRHRPQRLRIWLLFLPNLAFSFTPLASCCPGVLTSPWHQL